jgi:hypothetical protein
MVIDEQYLHVPLPLAQRIVNALQSEGLLSVLTKRLILLVNRLADPSPIQSHSRKIGFALETSEINSASLPPWAVPRTPLNEPSGH